MLLGPGTQNGPLSYANGEAMSLGSQMVSTCNLKSGEALGDAAIPTGKLASGNKKGAAMMNEVL